ILESQASLPTQYLTATALPAPSPTPLVTIPDNEALFLDRRYVRADTSRGKTSDRGNKPFKKSCFVCRKPGCWSTNHTEQERGQEKARWWAEKNKVGKPTEKRFSAFLQEFEGFPNLMEDSDDEDIKESDLVAWQITGLTAFTADLASYWASEMFTLAENPIYFWKEIAGDRVHSAHIAAAIASYDEASGQSHETFEVIVSDGTSTQVLQIMAIKHLNQYTLREPSEGFKKGLAIRTDLVKMPVTIMA
ncbi:hypothetical protein E4U59_004610, partial [Claviceps monticola]